MPRDIKSGISTANHGPSWGRKYTFKSEQTFKVIYFYFFEIATYTSEQWRLTWLLFCARIFYWFDLFVKRGGGELINLLIPHTIRNANIHISRHTHLCNRHSHTRLHSHTYARMRTHADTHAHAHIHLTLVICNNLFYPQNNVYALYWLQHKLS